MRAFCVIRRALRSNTTPLMSTCRHGLVDPGTYYLPDPPYIEGETA